MMSKTTAAAAESGIENFGAFPSLDRCAVVDSRFSSREEIISTLNATSLFNNVIVPQSLEDALEALESGDFDACILGPSLSQEASESFIQTAKQLPRAKHCAFVSIIEDIETTVDALEESGAHAVLKTPYRKLALAEQISHAVIEANQGNEKSPSVQKAKGILGYIDSNRIELSNKLEEGQLTVISGSDSYNTETSITVIDEQVATPIEALVDPLESIRELVRKLKSAKGDSPKIAKFLDFVNESVELWMLDRMELPEEEATKLLRQRILSYQQKHSGVPKSVSR